MPPSFQISDPSPGGGGADELAGRSLSGGLLCGDRRSELSGGAVCMGSADIRSTGREHSLSPREDNILGMAAALCCRPMSVPDTARERHRKLVEELRAHDYRYYVLD